jgi:hypothetical protein
MRRKKTITLSVLVLLAFTGSLYFSSEEYYGSNPVDQDISIPLGIGREAAFALYIGDKVYLHKVFDLSGWIRLWQADSMFHKLNLDSLADQWKDKYQNLPRSIFSPALLPNINDIQVLTLERLDPLVVATYAYTTDGEVTKIPGKGSLLFAICLKFQVRTDNGLLARIKRRLANAWFVPDSYSREHGTEGHWIAFDFRFNHSHHEYYQWFLTSAEEFNRQRWEQTRQFLDSLQRSGLTSIEIGDTASAYLYDWGRATARSQISKIESLLVLQDRIWIETPRKTDSLKSDHDVN